jgi:hypothetical protein
MRLSSCEELPFDLWCEDGLLMESQPALFVLLDREPIMWTVRGLAYIKPRLRNIGIPIARLRTATQFQQAWDRWLAVERQLLVDRIHSQASVRHASLEHRFLQAVLLDDADQAEKIVRLLEHRQRTGLKIV